MSNKDTGCNCGCEAILDGPDEVDGTPQDGGVSDPWNSPSYGGL